MAWRDDFHGILACASLLHVPPAAFPGVASRLAYALRAGGVWYMSFKLGTGERVADGRLFVDHSESTLLAVLEGAPVEAVETWMSADARPGRATERWLNLMVARRRGCGPMPPTPNPANTRNQERP